MIRFATEKDLCFLHQSDKHISLEELCRSVSLGRVLMAEENGEKAGWLRYNLFWDNTPFMNLLFVLEAHRNKGVGKELVAFWEGEMARQGFSVFMTSTQSDEHAQHFYQKLGYVAVGGFRLPGESYELMLIKEKTGDSI